MCRDRIPTQLLRQALRHFPLPWEVADGAVGAVGHRLRLRENAQFIYRPM